MISNLIKRPRGRPSKTIEQQEIENLQKYPDDKIFALARPPVRGRLAIEELIKRYELLKAQSQDYSEI